MQLIPGQSQVIRDELRSLRDDLGGVRAEVDELCRDGETLHNESRDLPRYGDFPELFPDLPPDEAIDLHDERAAAQLFIRAGPEAYRRLIPPESPRECAHGPVGECASWALVEALNQVDGGETNPGA